MLILRDAFLGVRPFDEFQASLGIARNVLSARLQRLVENGVLERRPYQDRPIRHEYSLTATGLDLYPVVVTMITWGDRWMASDDGPPMRMTHPCGHAPNAELVCAHCRDPLNPNAVLMARCPAPRAKRTPG